MFVVVLLLFNRNRDKINFESNNIVKMLNDQQS